MFNALPSGYYGVSVAADRVASGSRVAFRARQGYAGTRYSASGLGNATADQILESANGKIGIGLTVGIPVALNVYDYTVGDHSDVGIESSEFAASTVVDVGKSALVSIASVGLVLGSLALATAVGGASLAAAVATAPAWVVVGAVALVGLGVSAMIETIQTSDGRDADDALKEEVGQGFDAWGDMIERIGEMIG
jgi:hypothetical protein